jgi:hypothetical protein
LGSEVGGVGNPKNLQMQIRQNYGIFAREFNMIQNVPQNTVFLPNLRMQIQNLAFKKPFF